MILVDKLSVNPNNIETIIMDLDVTVTRWIDIPDFFRSSFEEIGIPYKDEYLPLVFNAMKMREYHAMTTSEADEDIYAYLLSMYLPVLKEYGKTGHMLKDAMFKREAGSTFISPETKETLKKLSLKYKLYCYTNWFQKQALAKLEYHNLLSYFEAVHSSENTFVKFDKTGFLWFKYKYHLDPEKTIVVGDSETDVCPCRHIGMHSIYINYNIKTEDDLTPEIFDIMHESSATITEFGDIAYILQLK